MICYMDRSFCSEANNCGSAKDCKHGIEVLGIDKEKIKKSGLLIAYFRPEIAAGECKDFVPQRPGWQ